MPSTTGYGPRHSLLFDGDESKYELWELKFLGYLKLQKLLNIAIVNNDPDADKNADVFSGLIQCLHDKSLTLIIRDAKDDG